MRHIIFHEIFVSNIMSNSEMDKTNENIWPRLEVYTNKFDTFPKQCCPMVMFLLCVCRIPHVLLVKLRKLSNPQVYNTYSIGIEMVYNIQPAWIEYSRLAYCLEKRFREQVRNWNICSLLLIDLAFF